MWASLHDIMYSVIIIFMVASRICLLFADGENSNNKKKDENWETVSNASSNQFGIDNRSDAGSVNKPTKRDQYIVEMNRTSPPLSISPVIVPDPGNNHTKTAITFEKSKTPSFKKKLVAIQFHDKTHGYNKLLL
eukprot:216318_1